MSEATVRQELVVLYQKMADHTLPVCRDDCRPSLSCCQAIYCESTRKWAREEWGVELADTGHPTLPFMGPTGCTVAPHLRPLCAIHACCINAIGLRRNQPRWTKRYFELREDIDEKEGELMCQRGPLR